MVATAEERVGVNKSVNSVKGSVEFSYKVIRSDAEVSNAYFFVIRMQETGPGRTGLVEVGADHQNDPRNYTSPYRVRKHVKPKFFGDGEWHHEMLDFDFSDVPTAFYSIFAPRINEGSSYKGATHLLMKEVIIWAS